MKCFNSMDQEIRDYLFQLLKLIHEVTHFNDVAGSKDPYYEISNALRHASSPQARINADSLGRYILGVEITPVKYKID